MMLRPILVIAIFMFALISHAQTWTSELMNKNTGNFYSDKIIQNFSFAGYHRGEKEIPLMEANVIDVSKAPYKADNTGKKDATASIQKAIDAAGKKGGVVYLPAGTYLVSAGMNDYCLLIESNHVVLRGDGAGKTFICNTSTSMRSKAIIKVSNGQSWSTEGSKQWIVKDLMTATTMIPVKNAKAFEIGDLVILRNSIDNNWIEEHGMLEYWKDGGPSLKGLQYCREVMAVNLTTNELTIDIPIRYALKTAHAAAVHKAAAMVSEVGIESLSIGNKQNTTEGDWSDETYNTPGNGSYDCHDSWAILVENAVNCWINKVSSYQPTGNTSTAHLLSNGIRLSQTKNVSILNCVFGRPQFGGGGGNGYMYRISGNENLLQNCTADFNRHGFVLSGMAASGNVFHRCIDRNTGSQTSLTGYSKTSGSGSDHHMHFSHSNLFDSCTVDNSFLAAGWRKWGGGTIHGLTAAHTVYWNTISNGNQKFAIETQQGRYGYVVGTSGNKQAVRTTAWMEGTESITDPVDHVEGIGKGATLFPQSLYTHQLKERKQH